MVIMAFFSYEVVLYDLFELLRYMYASPFLSTLNVFKYIAKRHYYNFRLNKNLKKCFFLIPKYLFFGGLTQTDFLVGSLI